MPGLFALTAFIPAAALPPEVVSDIIDRRLHEGVTIGRASRVKDWQRFENVLRTRLR
jgi:hypothetical protein